MHNQDKTFLQKLLNNLLVFCQDSDGSMDIMEYNIMKTFWGITNGQNSNDKQDKKYGNTVQRIILAWWQVVAIYLKVLLLVTNKGHKKKFDRHPSLTMTSKLQSWK